MTRKPGWYFYLSAFLCMLLLSCADREQLAPVSELQWQSANLNAGQYRVRKGDTLYAIAFRYEKAYQELAKLNGITQPYNLKVGKLIQLKPKHAPVFSNKTIQNLPSRKKPDQNVYKTKSSRPYKVKSKKKQKSKQKAATTILSAKAPERWLWPVQGTLVASFNPGTGKKGIDISGKANMPVRASANGTVAYAGNGLPGYGNLLIIKHPQHFLSAYAHNSQLKVEVGQHVKAGQVIATMGQIHRGHPGMHFEIRKGGKPVNPLKYLKKS